MMEIILTSSVLILALALLRCPLRGRVSPTVQYALWLLAAARLLIPGTLFTAPVTVLGAADRVQTTIEQVIQAPAYPIYTPDQALDALPGDDPVDFTEAPTVTITPAQPAVTVGSVDWAKAVWMGGGALTGAVLLGCNLAFALDLRRKRRLLPPGELPVPCRTRVYVVEGLGSPCLFGLLRPAIYLNEQALDPRRLEHILIHEETHLRQGDHLWSLLRSLCLAVHWYNPLVWLAAVLSRRDCELSCDHRAIRRLGEERRLDYGQTLLGMVVPGRSPAALLYTATSMSDGKATMTERIKLIARRPRMLKLTLAAVLAVSCLLLVVSFGGKEPPVEDIPHVPQDTQQEQPQQPQQPEVEPQQPQVSASPGRREDYYTILLAGLDDAHGRTDVLLLAGYDVGKQQLDLLSIPRDTAVPLDGPSSHISGVYAQSGLDGLRIQMDYLLGFRPDYTAVVTTGAIARLIDAMGGVTFAVPQDMNYSDPYQNLRIRLKAGEQTLSGEDALDLLRFRMYPDGDLGRIDIQQQFLSAALEQLCALTGRQRLGLFRDMLPILYEGDAALHTDLGSGSALWFAYHLQHLQAENVSFFTLPGQYDGWAWSGDGRTRYSYIFADPAAVVELVNERFNPYPQPITVEELTILSVTEEGWLTSAAAQQYTELEYQNALAIRELLEEPVDQWLPLLAELNWRAVYAVAQGPEEDLAMEILGALYQFVSDDTLSPDMALTDQGYYAILSATRGLDGAYAEGFSSIVYHVYRMDPALFARTALEELSPEQQERIADYLRFELEYADGVERSREEIFALLTEDVSAG